MPTGLLPVVDDATRVLVLGSMPGEMSLQMQQYYAHPRNAFWRIMGEIVSVDVHADYDARVRQLLDAGIGLWDVLHLCDRPGSLDSAIVAETMEPNDFEQLFAEHPGIARVVLNGAKAAQVFERLIVSTLRSPLDWRALPSTSPANAAITFDAKLQAWRAAVEVG
jgi:double-stranded uracil-DNA glycosylase